MIQLEESIAKKISLFRQLPTLPHILLKLMEVCNKPEITVQEVAAIIEKDPSMSGKILRLINSAYYGLPRKITDMESAVAYLGTNTVKNVAISASVYEAFKVKDNSGFNLKLFWWHSISCAVVAKIMAKRVAYPHPDEAFFAGLLHDIGRLVLWVNFKEEYKGLIEIYGSRPDLLLAGEIKLGATHCEVGAWLLDRWGLPSFVLDSVLYHHDPVDRIREALPLVQIIYTANMASQHLSEYREEAQALASELLGIGQKAFEDIIAQVNNEAIELARSLDIEIERPESKGQEGKESEKHTQLNRAVKDASILLGTLHGLIEAQDRQALLTAIESGLKVLFDVSEVLIFLYQEEKKGLVGEKTRAGHKYEIIEGVLIPLSAKGSIIVRAFEEGEPLDSLKMSDSDALAILDEQVIRLTGKPAILCQPLLAQGNKAGVMVIGLDETEITHIKAHRDLLHMFAHHAATALLAHYAREKVLFEVQAQRVDASYSMARKVVHEVNNPLSIIKNYLKLLGLKLEPHNIGQEEIRIINEEIDRVSQILTTFTSLSQKKIIKLEPVDLNHLVSNLVRIMAEPLARDHLIKLHTDLDPSLPPIEAEKGGIKQVLINLVKNAAEALRDGGNIWITTRFVAPPESLESKEGFVELEIKDDGPGIPEPIKAKIFEPYTTTKDEDHPGLGLSIVYGIVTELGGTITCESEPKWGTTFKVTLPVKRD